MTKITITATYDEKETTYDEILESCMELGFINLNIEEQEIRNEQS